MSTSCSSSGRAPRPTRRADGNNPIRPRRPTSRRPIPRHPTPRPPTPSRRLRRTTCPATNGRGPREMPPPLFDIIFHPSKALCAFVFFHPFNKKWGVAHPPFPPPNRLSAFSPPIFHQNRTGPPPPMHRLPRVFIKIAHDHS